MWPPVALRFPTELRCELDTSKEGETLLLERERHCPITQEGRPCRGRGMMVVAVLAGLVWAARRGEGQVVVNEWDARGGVTC